MPAYPVVQIEPTIKRLTTMKLHFWATAATVLALLAASPGVSVAQNSQAADFIVALVNSEPITNAELQAQI